MDSESSSSGDIAKQLTPRTKIRRMLSAFDDDESEDGSESTGHSKALGESTNSHSRTERPGASRSQKNEAMRPSTKGGSEENCGALKPARAKNDSRRELEQSQSNNESLHGLSRNSVDIASKMPGAYERVRGQLVTGPAYNQTKSETTNRSQLSPDSQTSPSTPRRIALPAPYATRSPSRSSSPGLFVSPSHSRPLHDFESDHEEAIAMENTRNRLQELVAQKRREREAREEASHRLSDLEEQNDGEHVRATSTHNRDVSHSDTERISSRPARKASKKAIEEMNKETQRISRNMQLTHQARTKIKFTTAELFKKFNFRQPTSSDAEPTHSGITPGSSSPARPVSDAEFPQSPDTPPSSPPSLAGSERKMARQSLLNDDRNVKAYSENRDAFLNANPMSKSALALNVGSSTSKVAERPSLRHFMKSAKRTSSTDPNINDLEIIAPKKPSRIAALDQVQLAKRTEPHPLLALRALAHVNDKNHERRLKGSLNASELKVSLTRRAREQAKIAELEKIQEAKDKGRYVESAEERERNQMQIESMIEKAQRENAELAKREKEVAKREGRGADDGLLDSDEDEEFEPSGEEDVAFSGSEDGEGGEIPEQGQESEEEENDGDDEAEEENADTEDQNEEGFERSGNEFVDEDADQSEEDEAAQPTKTHSEGSEDEDMEELNAAAFQTPQTRSSRNNRVIEDDDSDEEHDPVTPAPNTTKTPGSKASLAQAFGFGPEKSPAVGLSQLWGGTMAETQTQGDEDAIDSQQDSLAFLRDVSQPQMLPFGDTFMETQDDFGMVSQDPSTQQTPRVNVGPARITKRSQRATSIDQGSPLVEATQDLGFQKPFSPFLDADEPLSYSTVETMPLDAEDSPVVRREGHLQRGRLASGVQVQSSDHEADGATLDEQDQSVQENAFEVLDRGAKQSHKRAIYEKKRSEAKEMVEEQAEESEDEYAGIGGLSDDESGSEMDEETKRLIDDKTKLNVNHGKAAEFHAEWERARDEKSTTKLFRDITTGALRRQRDNGADLLDWDDEDEREARRRALRLRREARQRKALIDTGKLDHVVNNPKRQAFLSAVEDFAGIDEIMILDDETSGPTSQIEPNEPSSNNLKRPLQSEEEDEDEDDTQSQRDAAAMPAPKSRRTNTHQPPSTLEIRRTLSSLLDEPSENDPDVIADSQQDTVLGAYSTAGQRQDDPIGIESDKENESDLDVDEPPSREASPDATPPKQAQPLQHHKRTAVDPTRATVIDRMALKRQSSSMNQTSTTGTRLAFQAKSDNAGSFKIPSLLRRATTNASMSSNEGSLAEKSAAAGITGNTKEGVRMGGSKKSSVNFHVRETERRAKVDRMEKERKAERLKVGKIFGGRRGLGNVGGGKFE